jgi:hypothetical protein
VTPSRRVAAAVFGAAAVVTAALLYPSRPARQTGEAPGSHQPLKPSDRVRARLEQLRAEHPDWSVRSALHGGSGVPARPAGTHPADSAGTGTSPGTVGSGSPQDVGADTPQLLDEDPEDIPTMKKIAVEDKDPDRRLAAVTMLGASEDPEVIPVLAQALSDTNEEVRMAALQALSDFTDEPPVDAIENALHDPDPDIRFEALGVLADVGGESARKAIERALNDPDEDVRNLAKGIIDLETVYEDRTPSEQTSPGEGQSGQEPAAE